MLKKGPQLQFALHRISPLRPTKANTAAAERTNTQAPEHLTTMPAILAAAETAMQPAAATIDTTDADDDVIALLSLSNIKRKKSKKSKNGSKNKENSEDSNHSGEHSSDGSPISVNTAQRLPDPYSYSHLLDRVFDRLYTEMPQLQTRQRGHVPAFLVTRQRRTILWTNFLQVCTAMGRNPQHVMSFVTTELATDGTMDAKYRLTLKGRFQDKVLQNVIRKYLLEYVTCQMCRSGHTEIVRDPVAKMSILHCHDCSATRSITAISQGYVAVNREARRQNRAAQA